MSMILRSFHIPIQMDFELEALARDTGQSKSHLVRHFVTHGLSTPAVLESIPKSPKEQSDREIDRIARQGRRPR
jgi:hypothetical protein